MDSGSLGRSGVHGGHGAAVSRAREAAIVGGAALAAYVNAIYASFQFDDFDVVVHDPRVQSIKAWWDSMPGMRPWLKLSYAMNHASGAGVAGFHTVNVAIHVAAAICILLLLRKLADRFVGGDRDAATVAFVGAIVFALHPVQTEAVTYVCGRSASLSALACLLSMLAWVEGRERRALAWTHVLSPFLFAIALGVKESAVPLPAALLLWRAVDPSSDRTRDRLAGIAAHLVVLAGATISFALIPGYRRFFAVSLGLRDAATNLRTQASAVWYLLGQLVRFDRLNADPALPVVSSWTVGAVAALAAVIAIAIVGLLAIRRRPALAFGILWFLIWLAPTCTVFPRLDVANDRQLYLAIAGPAWLCGLAAAALMRSRPKVAVAVCVLLSLVLGAATMMRNRVYATEISFWENVSRKSPGNARAFNNLGYAYALARRNVEAAVALRQALKLAPNDPKAVINLHMLEDGTLGTAPTSGR